MDDKLVNGTLSDGGEAGAPSAPRRDSRTKRRWATALVVALTGLAVCLGVDLVLFASSAKDLAVEPVDLETWLDKEDGTVSIRVAFALAFEERLSSRHSLALDAASCELAVSPLDADGVPTRLLRVRKQTNRSVPRRLRRPRVHARSPPRASGRRPSTQSPATITTSIRARKNPRGRNRPVLSARSSFERPQRCGHKALTQFVSLSLSSVPSPSQAMQPTPFPVSAPPFYSLSNPSRQGPPLPAPHSTP